MVYPLPDQRRSRTVQRQKRSGVVASLTASGPALHFSHCRFGADKEDVNIPALKAPPKWPHEIPAPPGDHPGPPLRMLSGVLGLVWTSTARKSGDPFQRPRRVKWMDEPRCQSGVHAGLRSDPPLVHSGRQLRDSIPSAIPGQHSPSQLLAGA